MTEHLLVRLYKIALYLALRLVSQDIWYHIERYQDKSHITEVYLHCSHSLLL
jgi:hypothetical protein